MECGEEVNAGESFCSDQCYDLWRYGPGESLQLNPAKVKQGSQEWFQLRCGKITGSRIKDVMGTKAKRRVYLEELVAERLTGKITEHFKNDIMQWGTDHEDAARQAYQAKTGFRVEQVGFIRHKEICDSGSSPDGLVNADGSLEIKCPQTTTHIRWMTDNEVPEEHIPQMLWCMACTGREWCDFVSYDPRLPAKYQLFIKRLNRDNDQIAKLEKAVIAFNDEVLDAIGKLDAISEGKDPLQESLKAAIKWEEIGKESPIRTPGSLEEEISKLGKSQLPPVSGGCGGPTLYPWLPKESWDAFVQARIKLKKPMTDYAKKLLINKLDKLRQAGHDPKQLLDTAIERGWQTVWPPEMENVPAAKPIRKTAEEEWREHYKNWNQMSEKYKQKNPWIGEVPA
jgi:putative phage-type endonuclease